ncbi:hypothetical protein [Virgisporangium aurantiacum]|uniref:Uncharacterized protein n=1 Tax=Virgisporangium aurantiacum TaxID=175570 RepID=A0A8J3ZMU0_9ACTN|nr:hypothetical protein [Virgisporangium aurantiacum]GIJ64431.1 hypothetical protein Vau01_119470 [Virgisporangium aurantiacum]
MRYFISGLIAGATVSGVIAGILGGIAALVPAGPRWTLFAVLTALVVAFELAGRPLPLPQNRRAVPQTIIPQSNVAGPLQFGFEMGTGVRTFMPTALPHALLATVVLVGAGVPVGIGAGLGFGLGRALMPLVRSWHDDPRHWDRLMLARMRLVGSLCAAAFLITAVTLAPARWMPW